MKYLFSYKGLLASAALCSMMPSLHAKDKWESVYLIDGKKMEAKNAKWDKINFYFTVRERTEMGLPPGKYLNVQKGNKEAVVDAGGNYMVKPEWTDLCRMGSFLVVKKEGKFGLIGKDFKLVLPTEYDKIILSYKKRALELSKNGKWGILSLEGKEIIGYQYKSILSKKYFIGGTKNDGWQDIYDSKGKLLLSDVKAQLYSNSSSLKYKTKDGNDRSIVSVEEISDKSSATPVKYRVNQVKENVMQIISNQNDDVVAEIEGVGSGYITGEFVVCRNWGSKYPNGQGVYSLKSKKMVVPKWYRGVSVKGEYIVVEGSENGRSFAVIYTSKGEKLFNLPGLRCNGFGCVRAGENVLISRTVYKKRKPSYESKIMNKKGEVLVQEVSEVGAYFHPISGIRDGGRTYVKKTKKANQVKDLKGNVLLTLSRTENYCGEVMVAGEVHRLTDKALYDGNGVLVSRLKKKGGDFLYGHYYLAIEGTLAPESGEKCLLHVWSKPDGTLGSEVIEAYSDKNSSPYYRVKKEGKWSVYKMNKGGVRDLTYKLRVDADAFEGLGGGYYYYTHNGMCHLLDESFKKVCSLKADSIAKVNKKYNYMVFEQGKKWGVARLNGEVKKSASYDEITEIRDPNDWKNPLGLVMKKNEVSTVVDYKRKKVSRPFKGEFLSYKGGIISSRRVSGKHDVYQFFKDKKLVTFKQNLPKGKLTKWRKQTVQAFGISCYKVNRGKGVVLVDQKGKVIIPVAKNIQHTNYRGGDGLWRVDHGYKCHVKVDSWNPAKIQIDWKEVSFTTAGVITAAGRYEAAFLFLKGRHAIDIEEVSLLENGKVVATDKHKGFSGGRLRRVSYQLNLKEHKANATYTILAKIKGSGGTDSYGEVKVKAVK